MEIKVYGGGCARCAELTAEVSDVISESGIAANLEKVTDYGRIAARGIISTPALEVDGEIVASGRIPSREEVASWLGVRKSACGCGSSCGCSAGKESKGLNGRKLLGWILIGFAAVALVVGLVGRGGQGSGAQECASGSIASQTDGVTTVYYFHGTQRCITCNRIEEWTRAAIESGFGPELASGALVFRSVDVDDPGNAHFVQDFQLAARSVVVQRGGGFDRLDQVWQLVHGNESDFRDYITKGVRARIGGEQ